MINLIASYTQFKGSTYRPASPRARGFGEASSNLQAKNRAVHQSVIENMMEMQQRQAAARAERAELARQMESAREVAQAQAEYMRNLLLAMKIAARITRGDNVPQSDKDFLLEQSPGMYMLAMASRNHNNEDPKDHDALARGEGKTNRIATVEVSHTNVGEK